MTNSMLGEDELALIRREQRRPREERLARTGIPSCYWDAIWEDFVVEKSTTAMRDALMDYGDTFAETRAHKGKGFLLQGRPGVGKTMAACILGVTLSDCGFYVRFVALAEYMDRMMRQITLQRAWEKFEDPESYAEWKIGEAWMLGLRRIAHLVILDDVGKEHTTPSRYTEDSFDLFLRNRVNLARPVVITSNEPLSAWTDLYSSSMQSFIYQAANVISIHADEDMRRRTS